MNFLQTTLYIYTEPYSNLYTFLKHLSIIIFFFNSNNNNIKSTVKIVQMSISLYLLTPKHCKSMSRMCIVIDICATNICDSYYSCPHTNILSTCLMCTVHSFCLYYVSECVIFVIFLGTHKRDDMWNGLTDYFFCVQCCVEFCYCGQHMILWVNIHKKHTYTHKYMRQTDTKYVWYMCNEKKIIIIRQKQRQSERIARSC